VSAESKEYYIDQHEENDTVQTLLETQSNHGYQLNRQHEPISEFVAELLAVVTNTQSAKSVEERADHAH